MRNVTLTFKKKATILLRIDFEVNKMYTFYKIKIFYAKYILLLNKSSF